jgi:hypothetical protein
MKQKELAQWEKVRAKGRKRYILVTGVLSWGLPMFFAMTFIVNRSRLSPGYIGFSIILWMLAGALFGAVMWHIFERRYRKATQVEEI